MAELLATLGISRPILVGHSDGASVSLIHAANNPDALSAVVSLAAHSWVEEKCVIEIAKVSASPDSLVAGLSRHHADAAALFGAWSAVWLSDEFGRWDIRPLLGSITAPVLVAQGNADEYATDAMLAKTAAAIGENATTKVFEGLRHLLHHQGFDQLVEVTAAFIATTKAELA